MRLVVYFAFLNDGALRVRTGRLDTAISFFLRFWQPSQYQ
jgi:hypothetical protein